MTKSGKIKDKLAVLPDKPGVYLFKDIKGAIIYVGKAKSLRNRVRSYFTCADDGRYQYPRLVASIRDLEIILTRDEVEALATEAALIKRHNPKYNVDLRDDKSFPYLKITREPFPRVTLTRKSRVRNADYYGPFTNVKETRSLLRTLRGVLQICNCSLPLKPERIARGKYKLCLDYHIGHCGGPCVGKVSSEEYRKNINRFIQFLNGKHDKILGELKTEMKERASQLRFEEAASLRDRLLSARRFSERQRRIASKPVNRDAISMTREDSYAAFSVIKVRGGRIVGQCPFHMERAAELDDEALMEAFLVRHYDLVDTIPGEIYLQTEPTNSESLKKHLTNLAGRMINITVPKRGEKRKLIETAHRNAEHLLLERRLMADKRDFIPRAVNALKELLKLPEPPILIEAFDISNLFGKFSVASMVSFKDGRPYKSGYRIFRIRTVEGIDDVASIGEAVRRRYLRLKDEIAAAKKARGDDGNRVGKGSMPIPNYPDLILIDGGPGQLSRARKALDELELKDLSVIGLAKRLEEIYLPGCSEPIALPRSSSALRLLQQVRDEAHRFAISRHRMLRGKRQVKSALDDIEGVGPTRRQTLLKRFKSLKRLAEAETEEIAATPGISRKLAQKIKEELIWK